MLSFSIPPYYIFMISYISDYNNFPVKIPSF